MRRSALVHAALLVAIAFPAFSQSTPAASQDQVVFKTFRSVCLDTGTSPPSVRSKVEALGGTVSRNLSIPTIPNGGTEWKLSVTEHNLKVTMLTAEPPDKAALGFHNDSCGISDSSSDADSVSAIGSWLGIEPESTTTSDGVTTYLFKYSQKGAVRHPLSGAIPTQIQISRSGYWMVILTDDSGGHGTSAMVTHRFVETAANP